MHVIIDYFNQNFKYSRTLIIQISIIQTLGYPNVISNFKITKMIRFSAKNLSFIQLSEQIHLSEHL